MQPNLRTGLRRSRSGSARGTLRRRSATPSRTAAWPAANRHAFSFLTLRAHHSHASTASKVLGPIAVIFAWSLQLCLVGYILTPVLHVHKQQAHQALSHAKGTARSRCKTPHPVFQSRGSKAVNWHLRLSSALWVPVLCEEECVYLF